MIETGYALGAMAAMGAVTLGIRALPFLAARWLRRQAWVQRLQAVLPLAIMLLLTLHTALGQASSHPGSGWIEALAVGLVVALQLWRAQALLSIAVATVLYVALRAWV